jgi:hypothetical protein
MRRGEQVSDGRYDLVLTLPPRWPIEPAIPQRAAEECGHLEL